MRTTPTKSVAAELNAKRHNEATIAKVMEAKAAAAAAAVAPAAAAFKLSPLAANLKVTPAKAPKAAPAPAKAKVIIKPKAAAPVMAAPPATIAAQLNFAPVMKAKAPAKPAAKAAKTGSITLVDYSDKAVAVIGDTKPIKDVLKAIGGRWNSHLKCGAGWIFSKTKLPQLQALAS